MPRESRPNNLIFACLARLVRILATALLASASWPVLAAAQVPTGSIEGGVSDPTGAAIPNAKVTVTQKARGRVFTTTTDADGAYAVSALEPADYIVEIGAPRFKTGILEIQVQVGKPANGNITLQLGALEENVEVVASPETQIDTSRSTVGGVITRAQIENVPLDGRNFLALASLEPGVQVIDAGTLEMTKTGFTAVSIAGSEGRTTRIQVDGIDITDEVVGTTTQNFSLDALEGFQISQFTLDPSTSLSNTGAINLVTRSGANDLRGSAFAYWRDHNFASRIGGLDAPFHRVQGGFRVGGPAVKDKLFLFLNFEKTAQHNAVFVAPPAPFTPFTGFVVSPFPENLGTGRLDWNAGSRTHVFSRFTHDDNNGLTNFGGSSLSPVQNKNNTNSLALGTDISLSHVTHSFRYGRMDFSDYVNPAQPAGIPRFPVAILFDDTGVTFGPNFLSHQHSLQTNDQFRYDGTYVLRGHLLQYGVNYSHIVANLFGAAFSIAPLFDTTTPQIPPGLAPTDPLNYIPSDAIFGNSLGLFSSEPSRGFPFGGIRNDRFAFYLADSYKTQRNLTLNFGLRWEIDPGQVNGHLVRPLILDTVAPGQSGREPVDKDNFAPSFGVAWNIGGHDETVLRGGAGLYYETNIFENVLFDRANFLPLSMAPQFPAIFAVPGFNLLTGPSGAVIFDYNTIAMQPIGASVSQVLAAQAQYQSEWQASAAGPPSGPPAFEPPNKLPGTQNTVGVLFERHFTQPYSIHSNVGLQRRLGKSWLLQADYVRNRGLHTYLVQDYNRVGAANTLNVANAQQAIVATNAQFGCTTGSMSAQIDCAIANGASISAYAANGLDRGFAFPGNNPNFGNLSMIGTRGLSTYKGLLLKITGHAEKFGHFLRSATWGIAYALSRFEATQSDQANALRNQAFNNDCPTCLFGPTGVDRTHQLTVNTLFTLPAGLRWNTVTHISTALPVTLRLSPEVQHGVGEIFFTDLDGDGLGGDLLPGTNIGSYGRTVDGVTALNSVITNFNQKHAGQFTPVSLALIGAGLFTPIQLRELGAIIPTLPLAPAGQVTPDWFWTTDFRLSKIFRITDRLQLEPAVDLFNVFNKINFDPINNLISGTLSGVPGTVNGTPRGLRTNQYGLSIGSFSPGIPRALQFGLRLSF